MSAEDLASDIWQSFGAPFGCEDAALRYAQLLLDLQEALKGVMRGCPCFDPPCQQCALIARADEILKEADRG